jgi:hypothetical protein
MEIKRQETNTHSSDKLCNTVRLDIDDHGVNGSRFDVIQSFSEGVWVRLSEDKLDILGKRRRSYQFLQENERNVIFINDGNFGPIEVCNQLSKSI